MDEGVVFDKCRVPLDQASSAVGVSASHRHRFRKPVRADLTRKWNWGVHGEDLRHCRGW